MKQHRCPLVWRRLRLVTAAPLLLFAPIATGEQPTAPKPPASHQRKAVHTGVLAVAAPPQWALRLNAALGRAVAEHQAQGILGPIELRARLLQASGIDAALAEARDQVVRCEAATVAMQRGAAVEWARRSLATLHAIGDHYVAPQLTARAQMARGLAALLHPTDEAEALRAFGAAVNADPAYRPDNDLPPRVARLLARARQQWRPPAPPDKDTLRRLSALSGLRSLIWVALEPRDSGRVSIRVQLDQLTGRARGRRLQRTVPERHALATTAGLVAQIQRQAPPSPPNAFAVGRQASSTPDPPQAGTARSSWHSHWWVWTIVGAVVVGAGVGAAVAVTSRESPSQPTGFDLTFDLPR